MSERFFDDLARTLASPMPRRRALRLVGATLVAAAVPGLRSRAASAAGSDCGTEQNPCSKFCKGSGLAACGRESTNDCGQVGCSLQGCYKVAYTECCRAGDEAPWFCPINMCGKVRPECKKCPPDRVCGTKCCPDDESCVSPNRSLCCKKGEVLRNGKCACMEKLCGGKECCDKKRGEMCTNGVCCQKGETGCGGECCKPPKHCSKGKCCPKDEKN